MERRRFLASAVAAGLAVASTGCLDAIGGYETESFEGEEIPLVPAGDAYEWFEDDAAAYVDTRGESQFSAGHVPGAVNSADPEGGENDPTAAWDRDRQIVTYCDCPHSLAVQRAVSLRAEGFDSVYTLEDGFQAWEAAEYPIESESPDASVSTYSIEGETDAVHAGEYVHVSTADGDNREVARIEADGSFETTIRFPDLDEESVLVLESPETTREGTVATFTEGAVRA